MNSRIGIVQQVEPKIVDDLKDVAKVDKREIEPIGGLANSVLNLKINSKNEDGLDDQVD